MENTKQKIFSLALRNKQSLACELFESAVNRVRVANAYLLTGRAVDDKRVLARELAAHFNCLKRESNGAAICCLTNFSDGIHCAAAKKDGWCLNCQWLAADSHPQAWLTLSGEGKSNKIPVEKVRSLTAELAMTSSFVRIVIVPESDENTFHRPAANALLKSIEEPPGGCIFLFFADSAEDVLATIVSRCQVIPLSKHLNLGYWQQFEGATPIESASSSVKAKLDAARSALISNARRSAKSFNGIRPAAAVLRMTEESAEFTRHLLELLKDLTETSGAESQSAEQLLDLVVAAEIEVYRSEACDLPARSQYLSSVVDAAEKAKHQLNSFVKAANAIESFSFTLNKLRLEYSGEPSLAKR